MESVHGSSRKQLATITGEPLVLLVEPEPELCDRLVEALHERQVNVLSIPDSREVLAILDHYRVAALVVDAQLSLMSAFDLARAVRRQAHPAGPAIIIITDVQWSPAQKVVAVNQMGLLDLLIKPVSPTVVADLLVHKAIVPSGSGGQGPWSDTLVNGKPGAPGAARDAEVTAVADDAKIAADASDANEEDDEAAPADFLADRASHHERRHVERAIKVAQAGPVELRGNLVSTSFPMLLHNLYEMRATGALFLLHGKIKKIVYFKEGHPCYIKSNRLSECLGKILVREGMISESQCKESLRRMSGTTRQQGTVLIEMGVITPHDLVVGLERQLREKLVDIFTWNRGEYLFKSETRVPAEIIRLDVSNATLIADGVRSSWDADRTRRAIDPFLDAYPVPSPNPKMRFQELMLSPEEQGFLDCVDGSRTLRQLMSDSPLPTTRAMAVAYILLATGVIEAREQPEHPEPFQEDPTAPSPEEEETVRETLAAQLLSLQRRDAFGVLGVSAGASDAQVQGAYNGLAREFHPDRYRTLSAETRQMAQQIFDVVNAAYHRIATADLRGRYRSELGDPGRVGVGGTLAAEHHRKEAQALMRQGRWTEARQGLASAVELCKDAGDLRALLAWSTYKSDPENAAMVRLAIRELRRAVSLDPKLHETYLFLGRIYAAMGKTILAEKQFEKALQCNPDCAEALQELKIQKERRPPRRYRL